MWTKEAEESQNFGEGGGTGSLGYWGATGSVSEIVYSVSSKIVKRLAGKFRYAET